jgi:DNA-binding beta-propeller fold protein YncE
VVGDNVYVAEWFNSRVQIFSRDGSYLGKFGTAQFIAGIDIAPNGDIFLSHFYDHNLSQYDSGGTLVAEWGTNGSGMGELDSPYGVAVDAEGHVFVADSNNHRVQKFGPAYRSFKADLLTRPKALLTVADRSRR